MNPPSRYRFAGSGLLAALLLCAAAAAQGPLVQRIDPVEVLDADGHSFLNPFSGGILAARFALCDMDGDARPDLLLLNPDFRLRLYRNEGGFRFRRVPDAPFDTLSANKWFRFADLDGDGALEYITGGVLSEIMVYHNEGSTAAPRYPSAAALTYDEPATPAPDTIRTELETVPSFVDIDADGDLDLFAGNVDGSISFYRNDGTATVPRYVFVTGRYAGVQIISGGKVERDDKGSAPPMLAGRHGASVLDFFDIDADGDLDILFGDFFLPGLLLFRNSGNSATASFSMSAMDTLFVPPGERVKSAGFNQAVMADLDLDGDPDAVVSSLYPNIAEPLLALYENTGDEQNPVMERRTRLLTDEIDFGLFAAPVAVTDVAGTRLLVADAAGTLRTLTVDTLSTTTPWQLSAGEVPVSGLSNVVPAAGDLDADGSAEIVLGTFDGDRLRLLRRVGDRYQLTPWGLDTALIPSYAAPELVDLDGDADLDLLVGGLNGRFLYFRNIGTPAAPLFVRATPPSPFDTLDLGAHSVIRFADLDNDGALDAVCAARPSSTALAGEVRFLLRRGAEWREVEEWPRLRTDVDPVPAVLRIQGKIRLILGERAGGLLWWEPRVSSGVTRPDVTAGMLLPTLIVRPGQHCSIIGGNIPRHVSSTALVDLLGRTHRVQLDQPTFIVPGDLSPGFWSVLADGVPVVRLLVLP